MKKSMLLIAFAGFLMFACGNKDQAAQNESEAQAATTEAADTDEWKEMDDFHLLMAESFHPFMDSANLAPAKQNAAALAESAQKWASAPLPEKVNNDEVKKQLEQLVNDTKSFAAATATASDEELGKSLKSLHDLFHSLEESWHGGGHGHGEKHH